MLALLFSLVAAGPYEECDGATDCTAPDECVDELESDNTTCRAPCARDADCNDAGGTAVCGDDDYCVLFCDPRTGIACPTGFTCTTANVCAFIEFNPQDPIPCTCDDDCPDNTACADIAGVTQCVATCAADNAACPAEGTVCTLGPDAGLCLPGVAPDRDGGAICTNDGECRTSTCELNFDFGRNVCVEECENDDDCVDGSGCFEGFCGAKSIACIVEPPPDDPLPPDDDPPSCSSHTATSGPSTASLVLIALLALELSRRRAV